MGAETGVLLHAFWALIALISAASAASDTKVVTGNKEDYVAEPPALVENLGVLAVEHDLEARTLQLYVNWTAPTEGHLPDTYFLRVKSINKSSDYCGTMDYDEYLNSTETWSLVPPVVSEVEHDPHVLHECAYNVRVESGPYGGPSAAELNYTVPELVGSLWSCRRRLELPLPHRVHVAVVDHTAVDVAWEVDPADAQTVQGFSLKLGTEIVSPLPNWFEFGPELLLDVGNWSGAGGGALRLEHRLEGDLQKPVQYLVQVCVVDRRGCRGPPAEAKFYTTGYGSTPPSETLMLVVVVVTVVLLAAAAAVVAALLCRRRECWQRACGSRQQPQSAQPWLDGYSTVAVQSNGHSTLSDVASHPETEMEVSYASDIELLGIKARCDDV
ncbi:uncharacterized protein LOC126353794 isoform X2 [Schistocerca gregaria]|uniref:uncharacterized protein LOC126353794 isoform X2 n=2 Tax=Schistocerca gregaria TaxID=7010 RepID=UPI00211E174A|nr:uncharacterized protein LOC126353794 isoform X2 [Schistocerca gregaria]